MYTFEDAGGRSLTLRPEGTAPVCRAYLEHGMHKLAAAGEALVPVELLPLREPQAGRYRQFWQVGAEAIGSDDPAVDAEAIVLLHTLLGELDVQGPAPAPGLARAASTRAPTYRERLHGLPARARRPAVSDDVRERIDLNPLRAFDADDPGTQEVMRDAPLLLDELERRGPRALRRGLRAPATPPASTTRSTPRSCAASTTTRARSSSSPPTRSARRAASAAAGATTASSSSSAARRRPAWAGPRASSGCCWPPASGPRARAGRRPLRRLRGPRACEAFALAAEARAAGPGRPAGARRALAQGPAQAGGPRRRALRCHPGRRRHGAARTWSPASRRRVECARRPSSPRVIKGRHLR